MMDTQNKSKNLILLTGVTGYVGGRLQRQLEESGRSLRVIARDRRRVPPNTKLKTEVIEADALKLNTLKEALRDVHTAFYLIHSMGFGKKFVSIDRTAAKNFSEAAKHCGVRRIIYLGGLGRSSETLSPHLRSRQEVGEILRQSGVPVIELRASVVIGSGSLSFEMVRALTERLPIMITPRWVRVMSQPIAINDLLNVLEKSIDLPITKSEIYEVGGADQVTYDGLMREYALQRGLKRLMIPVPVLTPWLSGLWLGLITPIFARVGRALVESIQHPTVCDQNSIQEIFHIKPLGCQEAISAAIKNEDREFAETRWFNALSSAGEQASWGGVRFGTRVVDKRDVDVQTDPKKAFEPIEKIGGNRGWYYANSLWRIRGAIDLLAGGVGMRRGRPPHLSIGAPLDFWRVENFEPNKMLRLKAEMKVPGRAWLQFEVTPLPNGSRITQTAIFDPVGIFGNLYWYALYPIHKLIFAGMLREIARRAQP